MAIQSADDHQVIVPMGASKTPKYRYQARAAQTLKEIREASQYSTVELAALLQSRTGKLVTVAELEEWQAGEKDFPAWIIPAMIDISGARLQHSPWAQKSPLLGSRLKKIGLAVLAGGLLGIAAFPVASKFLPIAGRQEPPTATAQAKDQPAPTDVPTAAPTQAPTGQPSLAASPAASSLSAPPVVIKTPPPARPQPAVPAPTANPTQSQPASATPAAPAAPAATPAPTPTAAPTPTPAPSASATPTASPGLVGGLLGGLLGTVGGVLRLLI